MEKNKLLEQIENIVSTPGLELLSTKSEKIFTLTSDVAVKFAEWFDDPPNNDWTEMYLKIGWESGMPIVQLFDYYINNIYKQVK